MYKLPPVTISAAGDLRAKDHWSLGSFLPPASRADNYSSEFWEQSLCPVRTAAPRGFNLYPCSSRSKSILHLQTFCSEPAHPIRPLQGSPDADLTLRHPSVILPEFLWVPSGGGYSSCTSTVERDRSSAASTQIWCWERAKTATQNTKGCELYRSVLYTGANMRAWPF